MIIFHDCKAFLLPLIKISSNSVALKFQIYCFFTQSTNHFSCLAYIRIWPKNHFYLTISWTIKQSLEISIFSRLVYNPKKQRFTYVEIWLVSWESILIQKSCWPSDVFRKRNIIKNTKSKSSIKSVNTEPVDYGSNIWSKIFHI